MADRVGGAVETGRLAVPEARHALLRRARKFAEQLRAGDRRRRELLVEAGPEDDPGRVEMPGGALQLEVKPAERRARIAAHEHARVVAALRVEPAQVEHQPDERLHPVQQNRPGYRGVAVLERELAQRRDGAHACVSARLEVFPRRAAPLLRAPSAADRASVRMRRTRSDAIRSGVCPDPEADSSTSRVRVPICSTSVCSRFSL